MVQESKIEWCTHTSNPVKYRDAEGRVVWACVKKSSGCANCYAETLAQRYGRGGPFTKPVMAGLTPFVDEKELKELLSPRKLPAGSKCFVGDMTDVFGEWVSFGLLFRLFSTIWQRPDVTFQILTKRPDRMREFFRMWDDLEGEDFDFRGARGPEAVRAAHKSGRSEIFAQYLETLGEPPEGAAYPSFDWMEGPLRWPRSRAFRNVWLGTSVEDQAAADERLMWLRETPAAVRFISFEPLLADIGFLNLKDLHWAIVGGESGPRARPLDVAWLRGVVAKCQAAGVPVFVKQLGSKPREHYQDRSDWQVDLKWVGGTDVPPVASMDREPDWWTPATKDRKGGALEEWPEDLRVREWPHA